MEDRGNRRPRPPLEQSFGRVGSFTALEDGTLVPVVTAEPVDVALDPTDFQGGSPGQ